MNGGLHGGAMAYGAIIAMVIAWYLGEYTHHIVPEFIVLGLGQLFNGIIGVLYPWTMRKLYGNGPASA